MKRKRLLAWLGAIPGVALGSRAGAASGLLRRVRPSDPAWPSKARWHGLNARVGGRLIAVQSPVAACRTAPAEPACAAEIKNLQNPYYIGSQSGATETTGWIDAWSSAPSAYAVAAKNASDVVSAVNFAREQNLRLVVKGGGHSYQGTSNAADSLLVWTRAMNEITLHDSFTPKGCEGTHRAQPAVTLGAGVIWMHAYDAVTTKAGRYVQGGGCATVGVAGLIQSGGFGSFSKNYGMAAAGLLEAEVVTADGKVRLVNACTNPNLFWGIKGGGGGSLGVVTKITLRTRELPANFGGVLVTIKASSDAAFRRLIDRFVSFYRSNLFNAHWGEQAAFAPDNSLSVVMVFHGLDQQQAHDVWDPFLSWVTASPADFSFASEPKIIAMPARDWWNAEYLRANLPSLIVSDPRPGASAGDIWWAGNQGEVGQFLYGYESAWLPASLLQPAGRKRLVDALFASTRHWRVSLHFNKGLAGAPPDAIAAAKDTATNPAVLEAFALAITGGAGPPVYPGIAGHQPDLADARRSARLIDRCMSELRAIVPNAGSYVSEGNYFDPVWQKSYWGANYARLAAVKKHYDPQGLFFVHHGVGSEEWSADGFTRRASG